jgi:hypothetical protein
MSDQRKHGERYGRSAGGSGDRRRACRYRVCSRDAFLGRWEDSSFVEAPCRILDISLVGCLLELRPLPDLVAGQTVWFRPSEVTPCEWAEARLIAIRRPLFRRWQIRVQFLADLPYSSFQPLVFATGQAPETRDRDVPEHEMDHFWR